MQRGEAGRGAERRARCRSCVKGVLLLRGLAGGKQTRWGSKPGRSCQPGNFGGACLAFYTGHGVYVFCVGGGRRIQDAALAALLG